MVITGSWKDVCLMFKWNSAMRQPIKQLKSFQDLSSVKCRVEIILFFISNQPLWLPPSFKLWFPIFRLVRRAWPQMLEVLGARSARNPWGKKRAKSLGQEAREILGARSARNPWGKKRAKSWGQQSHEIADFFRVTIDKGRGATRSLSIKIAVVSRESYSSPGL